VVAGGLAAPERVGRFLVERRVLARLEHPNVARLLDAGVADEGTPWFAMEYVRGEPIDRYCDRRRLTVADRLALFERVCDAVAYAHRNLVVHRDLKPANVFVAEDGTPKLLDFGIAKLLEEEEAGLTGTGLRLLTPEYAAPEQLTGGPVTVAADVYSLGVMLYELLCGRRPYYFASRTAGDIERAVLTADPARPSAAATRPGGRRQAEGPGGAGAPEQVAAARATDPAHLARRLAGDLDAIALRALAKEPARRYPSAEALLDDLRNHRAGRPVRARPDTGRYRARTFVRRNRTAVAAAALLVGVLAAFAATAAVQQRATARERDRAEAALAEARRETATAEAVTTFLTELFAASDPYQHGGDTVTARQLLERGAARVDRLRGEPDVRARMLGTMGRAYGGLGQYERAAEFHRRAVAGLRALRRAPDRELAAGLHELGRALSRLGRLDSANAAYREALAMRRQLAPAGDGDVAATLVGLGVSASAGGRFADAERAYREALAVYRALPAADSSAVASALNNLAVAATGQGRLAAAESSFRDAIALYRALHGAGSPVAAQTLANLGGVLFEQGRLTDAEAALREALAAERAALGPAHPTVSAALGQLARTRAEQGDLAEADTLLRESLAIRRASYGPRHSMVGSALVALGKVAARRGGRRAADSLYGEALAVFEEGLPPDHPLVAEAQGARAALRLSEGRAAAAEPLARRAHATLRRAHGDASPRTAEAARVLGQSLTALGRYAEAEPLLLAAVGRGARGRGARRARRAAGARGAVRRVGTARRRGPVPGRVA
jgi:serine/threonine-protein kinase